MFKKIFNILKQKISRKKKTYALNDLDLKLKPYLSDIKNGFFVEACANDGVRESNTLYFEKNYGWNGLLIEAIPELANKAKKNRPGSIVENFALAGNAYNKPTLIMKYGDLMSIVKGTETDLHMGYIKKRVETYEVEVPAATLSSILKKNNVSNIDFLSLDLEGYELEALKGLDFNIWKPKFILVEIRDKKEIDDFMNTVGYREADKLSHHDYLYEPK